MNRTPKVLLLLALLAISVATLVQAIVGRDNQLLYTLATTVAHIALVVVGITYARSGLFKSRSTNDV